MAASKSKTPTASGISRLLAAAGFERSEMGATRSDGFIAEGRGRGCVRVYRTVGTLHPSDEDKTANRQMEDRFAETIEAAGYATCRDKWGDLIVTAKTED